MSIVDVQLSTEEERERKRELPTKHLISSIDDNNKLAGDVGLQYWRLSPSHPSLGHFAPAEIARLRAVHALLHGQDSDCVLLHHLHGVCTVAGTAESESGVASCVLHEHIITAGVLHRDE